MSGKRTIVNLDPDYEDVSEQQSKRRKVMEEDAKEATTRKIGSIIKKHFDIEIESKESELLEISQKLELARSMMDRLRACIVANFYGNAHQQKTNSKKSSEQAPMIHPTVRKFIGKAPAGTSQMKAKQEVPPSTHHKQVLTSEKIGQLGSQVGEPNQQPVAPVVKEVCEKEAGGSRQGRFKMKKRIIVGNLSKSIPADQRDDNDQATHKWMVYVRGPKDSPSIHGYVKKVWFFLHPSYRPNDLVEVRQPPFHLTRRGWGEFPVRVQIHFKDSRNKRVDIIHNLKLDRTYTGLQTLGAETVVDIEIERDMAEIKQEKKQLSDGKQNAKLHIKQEPVDTSYDHADKSQTLPLMKEIKLETVDHDYGRTTCLSTLGTLNLQTKVKKEAESHLGNINGSAQGVVSISTCLQTIGNPSVVTTQAMSILTTMSQSHNPLAVISSSPSKQQILASNSGNIVLTSPPTNLVLKAVGPVTLAGNTPNSTVNLKVIDSGAMKTGASSQSTVNVTLAQPIAQTGVPMNKSQLGAQNRIPLNQSNTNSGLVFLKCTDNQGKTFLIPQQINNTLTSPTKVTHTVGGLKTAVTTNRPILLAGGLPVSNIANLTVPGHGNKVQAKQLVQTIVRNPNTTLSTNRPQKPGIQNGPVFFIKPESINRTPLTVKTSNISSTVTSTTPIKVNSNLQIVQNCVKPVTPSASFPDNQSTINKGQLKVTPQGLIQVQGQNVSPCTIDTNLQTAGKSKQPIVLIPSNGKVTLLPGKGKSLLGSVSNTQTSSASGNNIILLNQSISPVAGGNMVCVTPSSVAGQNKSISKVNKSDMYVLQAKQTKPGVSSPNHVVIIPVSSEQSVASSNSATNTSTSVAMTNSKSMINSNVTNITNCGDSKGNDKAKMFIVLQNDKNTSSKECSVLSSKSASSLLTSQPSVTVTNTAAKMTNHLTQVTVSSSNAKPKQVLLVNHKGEGDNSLMKAPASEDTRKCIMDPKKKRQKLVSVKDFIQPLCIKDCPDMLSLIRSCVQRHPLVSEHASRSLHPYCAQAKEDWLLWNVGKRRASEWHRASSVRKYIIQALGGSTGYKGESLWTTKQILVWCRLHAYSPHYLEKPLHPTGIDIQAETSLTTDKHHKKFSSLTSVNQVHEELVKTEQRTQVLDEGDEEIDILHDSPRKVKAIESEAHIEKTNQEEPEYLPLMEGSLFVEDTAQQIGVRLEQTEIEPGYFGSLTHGMLYKSMENFMSDVLRETFAVQVNMGRYPDTLSVGDVFTALKNLRTADFLTNKYLGVEEAVNIPTAPT